MGVGDVRVETGVPLGVGDLVIPVGVSMRLEDMGTPFSMTNLQTSGAFRKVSTACL